MVAEVGKERLRIHDLVPVNRAKKQRDLRLQLATSKADDVTEALELFHTAGAAALHIAETRHQPRVATKAGSRPAR